MSRSAPLVPIHHSHTDSLEAGFFGRYSLGVKLGKGAFGQVHIATPLGSNDSSITKKDLAVKILDLRDKEGPSVLSSPLQKNASEEVSLWSKVQDHANVVALHEVFYDDVFCYIVMEKCTSSLFAYMQTIRDLNERSVGVILSQIFVGLEHMHAARVVHRDVKPDNFLVRGVDATLAYGVDATVKLCDFGLSAALPSNGMLKSLKGTPRWMSPEMIQGKYYDEKVDIWSAAVLAYVLLFGDFPYKPVARTFKAVKQAIVRGKPPTFEPVAPCRGQERSDSAVEFVKALLEHSSDKRPSASSAFGMPYMVAISHKQHMTETELPSLHPMLRAARKARAIGKPDLTKENDIDMILNEKQVFARAAASRHIGEETVCTWQTVPSIISLNPKACANSSSIPLPVSANSSLPDTSIPSGTCSAASVGISLFLAALGS